MSKKKKHPAGRPVPRISAADALLDHEAQLANEAAIPWGPAVCCECGQGGFIGPASLVRALGASEGLEIPLGIVQDIEREFVDEAGDVDRVLLFCLLGCGYLGFIPVAELHRRPRAA